MTTWILGVAASHNGGAALIRDGRVVVAVQSERLTRQKRQGTAFDQPNEALRCAMRYCLDAAGIEAGALAAVATSTPWDVWRFDPKLHLGVPVPVVSVPHHLAHAEYAVHWAETTDALVLVVDGSGSFEYHRPELAVAEAEAADAVRLIHDEGKETISAYRYDGRRLELVYRNAVGRGRPAPGGTRRFRRSLGHLWEWCSDYCFDDMHEAGKVMGLAPFGDPARFRDCALAGFGKSGEAELRFDLAFEQFRRPNRSRIDVVSDAHYADLAAHVQECTDRFLLDLARFLHRRHPARDLCYSGGVALNILANERLIREGPFAHVHLNGACEDNGTALGAALAAHHRLTGRRETEKVRDSWGRAYADAEIAGAARAIGAPYATVGLAAATERAAAAIIGGKVVGWFQGGSEFGPRALGHRSIIADARSAATKPVLDTKVKRREPYRPYAPAVLHEQAASWFDLEGVSPVMMRVARVRSPQKLPAITHVDGTARVQTVHPDDNGAFHGLIRAVGARTGVPVVLNTSFNIAGEPIVETPADALQTFLASGMDLLVLEGTVVERPA
ncbi:carbamoyltransferase C-terminal domain-containing protein [Desertibaculum subflavum]|uniref:carbamoyltransferase C-terminal domain-containing protein n=1 Tax=Desertibaculum subflavum TaxID=2268458 RepID=UPI000E6615FE